MNVEDLRIILERTFGFGVLESDAKIVFDEIKKTDERVFCRPQFHFMIDGVCGHCGYTAKDEPFTLTDLPRPWSTDEMKPLPYEVYKDFEQGQPFKDER